MRKKYRRRIYKAMKRYKKRKDTTPEYRAFRKAVLDRDNHTCVMCNKKAARNQVHHIVKWEDNINLRYLIQNGVTLCYPCHKRIAGKEHLYAQFFSSILSNKANEANEANGTTE